jgi:phage protein D
VLAQINQSDLAFLRERVRAVDAELWIDGSTLHAQSHSKRGGNSVDLSYGHELWEFSVLADLAGQRTSVQVTGWDVSGKAGLRYEATESVISGELHGDTSGASILSSALGQRKEALVHSVPLTSQETQAVAEAYFKISARRFVVGRGIVETTSQIRVGNTVNLKGLGPLFSGKYYLSEVRHLFDGAHGMRTEFTGERPGLGQAQ